MISRNEFSYTPTELTVSDPIWLSVGSFSEVKGHIEPHLKKMAGAATLPKGYLSISAINTFLSCPRKYELKYVYGLMSRVSTSALQGKTLHTVAETAYKYKQTHDKDPPLEMVHDTYSDSIKASLADTPDLLRDDHEDDAYLSDQGHMTLDSWYEHKLPHVHPITVEASYLQEVGGVPILGIIDLVDQPNDKDGSHVLVDQKFVKRMWSQGDVDNSLQLSVYSLATRLKDVRVDCVVKADPKKKRLPGKRSRDTAVAAISSSRADNDLRWATLVVQQVAASIRAGVFSPCSPESWACSAKYCGYWAGCRGMTL